MTRLNTQQLVKCGMIIGIGKRFFFLQISGPALGPTQSPTQWVSVEGFPLGVSGQYVKQASHLHLVPRLKVFYSNSLNTGWQSWVRSSSYMFLNNMLIIWTNTTCRSSAIVFYYILQHILAVQLSHHQVDVRYTKINVKGEMPLFMVVWIITISLQKQNNKVKPNT